MVLTAAVPAKPPPSPSLGSANGSVLSFPLHQQQHPIEHRLTPLEEEKIFQQLRNCDPIRYAAYRTAVKLDIMQQALKLNAIKLGVVCNVFQHHGVENDMVLDNTEAGELVSDIFFAASKVRNYYSPPMDVPALTAASLKFAHRVFDDSPNTTSIPVKFLKCFFVVLSDGRLRDKFVYLFRQFAAASNNFLTRANFSSLLGTLTHFAEFFGEALSFGRGLVDGSVAQCFSKFGGGNNDETAGLSEESFNRWLLLEPQIIVWLPTHYRLVSAKGVRHGIACKSCKMEDIIGMRYQCLRCLKYNLCQHCFFYGHSNQSHRNHKLEHPMQEYCYRSNRRESTRAFFKLLVNNLRKRKLIHCKQRYLCPATILAQEKSGSGSDESSGFHSEASSSADSNEPRPESVGAAVACMKVEYDPAAMDHTVVRQEGAQLVSQHQQMFHSIVLHMEEINQKKMESKQPLDNCVSMQVQLNRLKSLMDAIFTSSNGDSCGSPAQRQQRLPVALGNGSLNDPSVIESTPVLRHGRRSGLLLPMDRNFSPIVRAPIKSPKSGIMTNGTIQQSLQQHSRTGTFDMEEEAATALPSLTELSLGDLSSLLVKTGKIEDQDLNRLNVTEKLLVGDDQSSSTTDENVMEELETLMLRLDSAFQAFHGGQMGCGKSSAEGRVSNIALEIADHIHNFTYQYRLDHDL